MACTCQLCGAAYKVDVMVPDDIWEQIRPAGKPLGGGLVCGACIMWKLEAHDEYAAFILQKK